ncbi:hypothetical protein [Aquimarina sp. AU119]|uniref:hypothetical protein n=1 Tax=Aquimarina sp. AU119 TaxID=2108528 RepID=UPI000D68F512|nr:hypothetical protein [Aquimarina sp. AU119]
MKISRQLEQEIYKNTNQFKYLRFEVSNNEYVVSLTDPKGYEIIRGFGNSFIEAINDLHSSLL